MLWREYRLDSFRQQLFQVRGELFDYAREGHISFEDPAYYLFRENINTMIRFAHRLRFLNVLSFWLVKRIYGRPPFETTIHRWEVAVNEIADSAVNDYLCQMDEQVGCQAYNWWPRRFLVGCSSSPRRLFL